MKRWTLLLVTHLLLLILASISLTAVTGLKDDHLEWEYYRYLSQSGWGQPYQFPYSLPVVLTYIGAYGTGLVVYAMAWQRGSPIIGAIGVTICAIGLASFGYELTHWFTDHYGSWIASFPAALVILAVPAAFRQYRQTAAPRMPRANIP